MKIAFVYDSLYPFSKGGGERRIYEIGRRLANRGHEVELLGMKWWEGSDTYVSDGLTYRALGPLRFRYLRSGRGSIMQALGFGANSWRLLAAGNYDIIDCGQWPYFHFLPARVHTWLRDSKLVVSWYEVWGNHWYEYLGFRGFAGLAIERAFCKVPDLLIAVSEQTRTDLLSSGVSEDKVETIPNGIDFTEITAVAPGELRFDVVCCGRLKNHKNLNVLLDALAIAKKSRPGISACLIGDGPEKCRLEAQAHELGLTQNVKFTGSLEEFDDVIRLMKGSKLFVNPSTKEGGGSITLFEANACGLPVIAVKSPNGIDASLIAEGKNGFFVESLSAELIAKKILELLEDEARRASMSNESVAMASGFDWEEITRHHEELYARACSQA